MRSEILQAIVTGTSVEIGGFFTSQLREPLGQIHWHKHTDAGSTNII